METKATTLLLVPALLCSCTVINGNRNAGTYTYATLGGDARGYAQTPDGVTAEAVTTSESFQEATKAARWAIVAAATKGIASDLSGAWKSVAKAKEATKAASIKSAASVEQSKIAADVTKATFEPTTQAVQP